MLNFGLGTEGQEEYLLGVGGAYKPLINTRLVLGQKAQPLGLHELQPYLTEV